MTAIRKTHLCIGGPMAGTRYQMEDGVLRFRSALRPNVSVFRGPVSEDESVEIKTFVYTLRQWSAGGTILLVWVPEGQTDLETMEQLLETYADHHTGMS